MAHTTQDLREFIDSEAQAAESKPKEERAYTRAYLLGLEDAFGFLTSGRTSLGLAGRNPMDDTLFQHDPNRPASTVLPKGVTSTEPANPTVAISSGEKDLVNQGNDHTGKKAVDRLKEVVQTKYSSEGDVIRKR